MNSIVNKPYKPIWYSILLLIVLSMIGFNNAIDIQLHDTYFVIALIHTGILFSIYLGIIGIIYWLIRNKRLVNWMTVTHVVTTNSTFTLIIITGLIFKKVIEGNIETFRIVNQILFVLIIIALLSQLIFITNLVMVLLMNKPKKLKNEASSE